MPFKCSLSRRGFLRMVAFGGSAAVAWKLGLFPLYHNVEKVSKTRILMGTVVNLTVIGQGRRSILTAIEACLDRMAELESVLSRFKPESHLSHLNRTGHLEFAHPALLELLLQARYLSEVSGGAFDVTVKPLLDVCQHCQFASTKIPSDDEIGEALALVDYRNILIERTTVSFAHQGMSISLDGIAKGYIVDKGVEVLRQHGFENVLVEAGGDLLASGYNAVNVPWKVGVQSPRKKHGDLIVTFSVQDRAVATSGDYMQPFSPDFRSHHILDPGTGKSPRELASVTVIAPTGMLADGLATTMMVLGSQESVKMLKLFRDCEAYLVTKDLRVVKIDSKSEKRIVKESTINKSAELALTMET